MQDAMVVERGAGQSAGANQPRMSQMPLSFLRSGEVATVAKVREKGEVQHHLENLGFVEGAQVKVVSEQSGNLIVEIKGAQVALNKQVAQRIVTR